MQKAYSFRWTDKALLFLLVLLCVWLYSDKCQLAFADEVTYVCHSNHHGTYVYDAHRAVKGFLLNGCPIDLSLITPTELADTAALKTPYCVNIHNINTMDSDEYNSLYKNIDTEDFENMVAHNIRWGFGMIRVTKISGNYAIPTGEAAEFYPQLPIQYPDCKKTCMIEDDMVVSVIGRIEDYYYIKYQNDYGYVSFDSLAINPSLYKKGGIRFKNDLESYIISRKPVSPTGKEQISMFEAIEIAREAVRRNTLIIDDSSPFEMDYVCTGMFTTGYETLWEVEAFITTGLPTPLVKDVQKEEETYVIWIDTESGEVVDINREADMHG